MKQFIFCTHDLEIKTVVMTDATVRNFDCVTPQKTEIEIKLNYDIENNDIVIIRDQNTMEKEYIGIIDTVAHDEKTTILLYPFESIFDNDCILSELDGSVFDWIKDNIEENFVATGDSYNDYPIVFENELQSAVQYKRIIESKNLLDNLNDIFLNTGVYIKIGIRYDLVGHPDAIVVGVYNANEEETLNIRYDNPLIVNSDVLIERSHTGNANKAIIRVLDSDDQVTDIIKIYLKEDNTITSNPTDAERIKQVKPMVIDYKPSEDEITTEQQGEAIVLLAEKALCGNSFDHSIEFTVVLNGSYEWNIHKRCDFTAEDRVYSTFVTSVEYGSDQHAKIKLGAYRYTLTDRFKAYRKQEVSADSIKGISVTDLLGAGLIWFTQNEDGDLYLNYNPDTFDPYIHGGDGDIPKFNVDENDHLIFSYIGEEGLYAGKYEIDSKGKLVYNL